jgi:hypothetical protein
MKNCIHCGTPVKGSAASFCPKCKKPLKSAVTTQRKAPKKSTKAPTGSRSPVKERKNPVDGNYDGYYNDRLPDDAEHIAAENLPHPDSWQEICEELKRNGFTVAASCEDGIKIILTL